MQAQQRKQALLARRAMSAADRAAASAKIAARIMHSHEFFAARSIACYLPMQDEVDPTAVIQRAWRAKKRVFCPLVENHGVMTFRKMDPDTVLRRSDFGLWEPAGGEEISARQLDLVLTPLVAFDANGNRIGMGGGYFDRCFAFQKNARQWRRPKLIGLAFACQKFEKIAANPWDIPLSGVVTEAG